MPPKDIVIIGGGPAGLNLAAALRNTPAIRNALDITLIDAAPISKFKELKLGAPSNRVSSISHHSMRFLERAGVAAHLDPARIGRISEMRVWDWQSQSTLCLRPSAGLELPSFVENVHLQKAAFACTDGVDVLDSSRVVSIHEDDSKWPVISLETPTGPKSIRARLLIGADGINSPVRAYSNIDSFGWPYGTKAVAGLLSLQSVALDTDSPLAAYQRFLPHGPIALLPLSHKHAQLTWSTSAAAADTIVKLPKDVLAALVNLAFSAPGPTVAQTLKLLESPHTVHDPAALATYINDRLASNSFSTFLPPEVTAVADNIGAFPLRMSHVDKYTGNRTALVGDAAHIIHPLAGLGLNMGLADVESLVNTIAAAVKLGQDPGSPEALRPYPRERYIDNHKILSIVDHLHQLYTTNNSLLVAARSFGVDLVDQLDVLKRLYLAQTGASDPHDSRGVFSLMGSVYDSVSPLLHLARSAIKV